MSAVISSLEIKGTKNTPFIRFDSETNCFYLSGISLPENTTKFYEPVFDLFQEIRAAKQENLKVQIRLVHFNTTSSKVLFKLIKLLSDMSKAADVEIKWFCDPDDEDMLEIIDDFMDILDVKIDVVMQNLVPDEC